MRNRTQTFGFRAPTLYHWATETMVNKIYYKVHMIRVLHAARISNVNSVMFVNRIREMVSFELGKEIEKDAFVLSRAWNKGKDSESPWGIKNAVEHRSAESESEVRFLVGSQNFFFVPRSWQDEKHLSLFLYRAQNESNCSKMKDKVNIVWGIYIFVPKLFFFFFRLCFFNKPVSSSR